MERVWVYPWPPAVDPVKRRVRVERAGELPAESTRALRVLETQPPTDVYGPPQDVGSEWLERSGGGGSWC